MIKKLKENYTLIYVIIAVALFKIGQKLGSLISNSLYKADLLPGSENAQQFIAMTINDLVVVVIMIVLLILTNKTNLLNKKGQGFIKSIPIAAYPVGFIILALVMNISYGLSDNMQINDILTIITYIICMFAVGLSEELCNRAVSALSLLEHFGTNKKGIWTSAIISGVLFGCLHLFNLSYGDPIKVIVQVIAAATTGVLYAAIYFRSGNLWLMVTIHAMHDIAAAARFGIFNGGNVTAMLASEGTTALLGLITVIPQVIAAIYLLRDKKIGEVKTTWSEIKG